MAIGDSNSDQDQYGNIDPSRLEAGLNDSHNTNRRANDSHISSGTDVRQTIGVGDHGGEGGRYPTSGPSSENNVADEASPPQRPRPAWSKVINWVKQKEHDRPFRLANLRPSTSFYTKFDEGSSADQEKPSGDDHVHEYPQEGGEDGEAKSQVYTQAAAETVHTFLRQNSAYQRGANLDYEERSVDQHVYDVDYVPAPEQYKPGLFGALLAYKLNHLQQDWSNNQKQPQSRPGGQAKHDPKGHQYSQSLTTSLPTSGTATPSKKVKWYEKPEQSNPTAAALMQAALSSTGPSVAGMGAIPRPRPVRPKSADMISTAVDIITHGKHHHNRHSGAYSTSTLENHVGLITEVADIIARRDYLIKLCGAFMEYGAPTHRMEEYLGASARALLIDADFLHIPGAMICTFADRTIHANNVDIVRKRSGLDFARLKDVFNVYKCVIHDKLTAEDGIREIDNIRRRPDNYSELFRILMFGVASVVVGPFSFQTRPIDFGPIFLLGCAIGFMQVKIVPRSEHFGNVFEVFACVFAAFISRALGSIQYSDGQYIFCFSGMAQSSIAMILPGFMMLNSALELQSRNLISGSVRMVYVIVYVLFLAFGLLIGTTVFGLIKRGAVSSTTCDIPPWFAAEMNWKLIHTRFIWAPLFACCVGLIYQARWRQLPVMALIAVCGHQANFWISTQLSSNAQVANAIGAFVIGCISNLYSRLFHGLAATAMLPAIYCQVPGGLASSGSLVAGVVSANQISGNSTASAQNDSGNGFSDGTIFTVGYSMVQVAIGISVGLYLSALVVYPYGKRKSALGSF
ncbi:Pheromone-regulated membrane protein 10 [Cladophialophora carrionii]|uniref:Pheromone-regulated membrane protein 10 n=1 Tax=Cladophialophora carrionii TaxID=86049 RepID=A0A1C1CL41_9EURO|nr:Pheromone-regulated membrane protein 10 [Cladophialophora carrionii]